MIRRGALPAALAVVAALLLAGCGATVEPEPTPAPTATEPVDAPSASATPSAAPAPTTEPTAEASAEPTPGVAQPPAVTPPPRMPLPSPDVRVLQEVPAGGPEIVATERYNIAVVCDGSNTFWNDDGDARGAWDAESRIYSCLEGSVVVGISVPGYWAKIWASVEDDVPLPMAERQLIGQPFDVEQLDRIAAASGAELVDVTFSCQGWVGMVFGLGEREYRCVDWWETIGFTQVPIREALTELRLPAEWGGEVRLQATTAG